MLAKLLKYDFKAMFKIFLPLWGVLLVVSGVNRLISGSPLAEGGGMGIFTSLLGVMYVLLIMAVMVVTTVIIIARFYQGLLKDEGYLMFTIPVKPWQLLASKLLSAMVISIISGIVALASVAIIAYFPEMGQVLAELWKMGMKDVPNFLPLVILLVVSLFVGIICSVSQVYASMALGHLAGSHRVGFAVLAFIVLSVIWSTVGSVIGMFGYPDLTSTMISINEIEVSVDTAGISNVLMIATVWGLILDVVRCVVHLGITNYILSRRLNLE